MGLGLTMGAVQLLDAGIGLGQRNLVKTLALNVSNPTWDSARGNLANPETNALNCPVATKYLIGRDLDRYEVLIWSQPRVVVTGRLSSATSAADIATARRLAIDRGQDPAKVDYMLFDQRDHKHRKNRHKLIVESMHELSAEAGVCVGQVSTA